MNIFINIAIILTGAISAILFFSKKARFSDYWHATVSPLASIIGSGFLIVAPLLWILAGDAATWILLGIVLAGYSIGYVIRFNIQHTEAFIKTNTGNKVNHILNNFSNISLSISYFISIAFYARLLSSFFLKNFLIESTITANLLTTFVLLSIGAIGYFRGFKGLESFMEYSVSIKLSIIIMLITGLFLHDWLVLDFNSIIPKKQIDFTWISMRKIFGILLIVQGFEISRYIGNEYSVELRIKTMKTAQIISSIIYFSFVYLMIFIIGNNVQATETEIIDLSAVVSAFLPVTVTIGAICSQFSAAIADTIGCGGTIYEYSNNKISCKIAYLIISNSRPYLECSKTATS